MQAASLAEIKRELKTLNQEEILQLCLRLGRFKKDNKELLTYLLFESKDEDGYILSISNYIEEEMLDMNYSSLYYIKKSLRKILRNVNKMIRYSGNKRTEVEVLIHFCQAIRESSIEMERSIQISNLYERQIVKIKKALNALHEDLQADYERELEAL